MKLEKAIEGFLLSRSAEGFSVHTISDYRVNLTRMASHLGDVDLEQIDSTMLYEFFAWLRNDYVPVRKNGDTSPLKPASLKNAWIAMRSFFAWAELEFKVKRPDTHLKRPQFRPEEIVPFNKEEMANLLRYADLSAFTQPSNRAGFRTKTPRGLRNKAIVAMLLDTGLRNSELCRLRVEDFEPETGRIFVGPWGRGNKTKSRNVFLGKKAKMALWAYLASRDEPAPSEPLLVSDDDQQLTRSGLYQILKRVGNSAKVTNVYPHRFRHTFAIEFLRNGGNVFVLQRILGHSTIDMTKRYVAIADIDAEQAIKNSSPIDNL